MKETKSRIVIAFLTQVDDVGFPQNTKYPGIYFTSKLEIEKAFCLLRTR